MTQTMEVARPIAPQPVTSEQANAWVGLATEKNRIAFELEKQELAAQGILLKVQQNSEFYGPIDLGLAEYRKAHTAMVEVRKQFTSVIDSAIVQPLMEFEKRVDPKNNETYTKLINRSLSLRKAEADKVALQNAKNQEISTFKAHVINEFSRVAAEYRAMIRREMTAHYNRCLSEKQEDPLLEKVKQYLKEMPPPPVSKFNARHVSNDELLTIYNEVPKLNFQSYYQELMKELDNMFANYTSDIANPAPAIEHQLTLYALKGAEEESKVKEEAAINTLVAAAETIVIDTPKIKKTVQVEVIESEAWIKAVMAAFIVNMPKLSRFVRVKKLSNLTVGQMADALGKLATETGEVFTGLQFKEVEK